MDNNKLCSIIELLIHILFYSMIITTHVNDYQGLTNDCHGSTNICQLYTKDCQ